MKYSYFTVNLVLRQIIPHKMKIVPFNLLGFRNLYSPSALGVDGYLRVRERIQTQFSEMGERFRKKMRDFCSPQSVNMVFTEDLKHMVHLAEPTEEDMELIEEMMVKFNQQNRDLRFGSYVFGPVVMRMYHHLNKPKEALKVFLNPELTHFFDQIISFQILMDLLFMNEMYDEVLQVMDIVKEKQLPFNRYPKNLVVLATAAAYKKNTPEALQYTKELWAALQESGHQPMRRAVTFASALAINQGEPHIALELLSTVPRQNYVTVRNLKVSALADVNRPDDAIPLLRSVLEQDAPLENKNTFCSEIIEKVRAAVNKSDKKDVQQEFNRVVEQLTQLGHVSEDPLDSTLCSEIERVPVNEQEVNKRVLAAKFAGKTERTRAGWIRPSLQDME